LLFYHSLKEAEAATVLQVSARTVRRRWLRAKLRLHEALKPIPGWEAVLAGNQPEG
jgi:DNA-directed RNA polymerase specialized sigma24 family protein